MWNCSGCIGIYIFIGNELFLQEFGIALNYGSKDAW